MKKNSDPSVCSGHGNCTSQDFCVCTTGFSGVNCNITTIPPISCFGIPATSPSVCNGNGVCIAQGLQLKIFKKKKASFSNKNFQILVFVIPISLEMLAKLPEKSEHVSEFQQMIQQFVVEMELV